MASVNMKNIIVDSNIIKNVSEFCHLEAVNSSYIDHVRITNNILDNILTYGFYTVSGHMNRVSNFIYSNNTVVNKVEGFNPMRKTTGVYYKTENNTGLNETIYCQGSPEGIFTAPMGSIAIDMNSGNMYLKQSTSTSNTGWILK